MSTKSKFGHLEKYDPAGKVAVYNLPFETGGSLNMMAAGQSNKRYFSALASMSISQSTAQKISSGDTDNVLLDRIRERDIEIFPKYVIIGWEGVCDDKGKPVKFTEANCREFLEAIPLWVLDQLRNFAGMPSSFNNARMATREEVQRHAGK